MAYLLDAEPIERSCKITIDTEGEGGSFGICTVCQRNRTTEREREREQLRACLAQGWEQNLIECNNMLTSKKPHTPDDDNKWRFMRTKEQQSVCFRPRLFFSFRLVLAHTHNTQWTNNQTTYPHTYAIIINDLWFFTASILLILVLK